MSAGTFRRYLFLPGLVLLAACAGQAERYDRAAGARGLTRTERLGSPFRHAIFERGPARTGATLHVYLEGDGTPWTGPGRSAADPTPRVPLALALMAADPQPALLVGRPCYHLERPDPACAPQWWADRRYAPEVVASLAAVVSAEIAARGATRVTLIGFSGGGTLAMLLAPELPQVSRVITVAANLDTAAWTAHHAYPPLTASLDPATRPPLPARIAQTHYLGERDTNVPPSLLGALRARTAVADWQIVPGFDHRCCWVARWPVLLDAATARGGP
jgi:pimeloyl-ACP methyl ester carboxylesterase